MRCERCGHETIGEHSLEQCARLVATIESPYAEAKVPERIVESLRRYADYGVPTGDMLRAVLSNDLRGAFGRADDEVTRCMPAIVAYCHNRIPSQCWGSERAVNHWIAWHRMHRAHLTAQQIQLDPTTLVSTNSDDETVPELRSAIGSVGRFVGTVDGGLRFQLSQQWHALTVLPSGAVRVWFTPSQGYEVYLEDAGPPDADNVIVVGIGDLRTGFE